MNTTSDVVNRNQKCVESIAPIELNTVDADPADGNAVTAMIFGHTSQDGKAAITTVSHLFVCYGISFAHRVQHVCVQLKTEETAALVTREVH
jgi:hypothetical protein